MAKFLDNDAFGPAVRELLQGGNPRCAVAFWGKGACATLFGKKLKLSTVQVVCDVSMGGTNPKELRNLGAPSSERIAHIRGLHSKVYISDAGAIIGSGNASENGVGFSATASLIEAGVLVLPSSGAYKRAVQWFQSLFDDAEQVGKEALAEAEAAWKRRARMGGGKADETAANPNSLLETVRADPKRFRGIGFVLTSGSTAAPVRDRGADAVIAKDAEQEEPELTDNEKIDLKAWPRGNTFSGWERSDVSGWPERFICAHRGHKHIRYWFYERHQAIYTKEDGGIIFARISESLKGELTLPMSRDTMAETDKALLAKLFSAKEGHRIFVNGEELARALDAI